MHPFESLNEELRKYIPWRQSSALVRVPCFWNVDRVSVAEGGLKIEGWALPIGGRLGLNQFLVNGAIQNCCIGAESPGVAIRYPWWPNAQKSRFSLFVDGAESLQAADLTLQVSAEGEVVSGWADPWAYHFSIRDLSDPMPPLEVQARIGSEDAFQFAMSGKTLAVQLRRAYEKASGRELRTLAAVADWGCGSGRVARHMLRQLGPETSFAGYDIDAGAVEWANRSIGPRFHACDVSPPLPSESNTFDLVYAYSVFTHLAIRGLRVWAAEIARVMRPGGYFLFTTLSHVAMLSLRPYAADDILDEFESDSGFTSVRNDQLESAGFTGDYYRNAWYSHRVIRREFSQHFRVVGIEQNFHHYQDLVICQAI